MRVEVNMTLCACNARFDWIKKALVTETDSSFLMSVDCGYSADTFGAVPPMIDIIDTWNPFVHLL